MKLNDNILEIESNLTTSSSFTIKASAKAFKILSDSLYSDKIRAIIRELCCNAADSHIEAGNNDKFVVHLPNSRNSEFYVQDFGVGLSEKDILELYCRYFDSNKTNSNDYTGALGLGSKSPFSYTDSFIVISIFNHKETTYLAYIDEHGVPAISKTSEIDTVEHNGMKICFDVKPDDFNEFQYKAISVLSAFEKRPTVKGWEFDYCDDKLPFNDRGYFRDNTNAGIYSLHENVSAWMGNVIYPIDLRKLDLSENIVKLFKSYSYDKFIIRFNIGDLDITPSREHLSYTQTTIKKLETEIKRVFNDIIKTTVDSINNEKNYYLKMNTYNKLDRMMREAVVDKINFDEVTNFYYNPDTYQFNKECRNFIDLQSEYGLKDICLKYVDMRRNRKYSGSIKILSVLDYNIVNFLGNNNIYFSMGPTDDSKFKYGSDGGYLLTLRKTKECHLTKSQIMNLLQKKLGFQNPFLTCENLVIVKDEDEIKEERVKYDNDMFLVEDGVAKRLLRNAVCGSSVYQKNLDLIRQLNKCRDDIQINDLKKGNLFIVPLDGTKMCDNNNRSYNSQDLTYLSFLFSSYYNYIDRQGMKRPNILFCRGKAVQYLKDNYDIPVFQNSIQRICKKNVGIKKMISDYMSRTRLSRYIDVFKKMDGDMISAIEDDELKKEISNYRDFNCSEIRDINENNVLRLYPDLDLKDKSISGGKYDSFLEMCKDLYYTHAHRDTIIKMINLIYNQK